MPPMMSQESSFCPNTVLFGMINYAISALFGILLNVFVDAHASKTCKSNFSHMICCMHPFFGGAPDLGRKVSTVPPTVIGFVVVIVMKYTVHLPPLSSARLAAARYASLMRLFVGGRL